MRIDFLLAASDCTMTHPVNLCCIEDYRTYLVECYKQVKPPCVLDWPPQDKLQYVIPTLFTTEQPFSRQPTGVNTQYRNVKLTDIFAISKERGRNLTVLFGSPGGGKSTLAWFMSREWARGQLYQEYRLLVHVSFRDHPKLLSATCLEDIIPHPDDESKQTVVQFLKQTKGNGVAIIIDSYDEGGSSHLYSNAQSVVDILLQVIPKASLLLMSRPTDIVNSLVQHSKNIASIWLSEFSREQVAEYFSRNMEDGTEINMHFDQNVGLLGLCYTPINASIVLFLLHVCKPTQLPSTQTELFECVTINLLIRYATDQWGFEIEGPIKELKKVPFHWQFKMLCQQTYYAVFGEESIDDMPNEDFLDMPLNGVYDTLGLVSLQRLPNGMLITYGHLLFRDFFAAYYLSTLEIEKQTARVQHLCQQSPESPMLSFTAGLTKLSGEEIFGVLANFLPDFPQNSNDYEQYCLAKSFSILDCDPKVPDHRHSLFTLLKCVYESQRPKLCCEIISRVGDMYARHAGEVRKVYLSLSYYGVARFPQGCNAVGYFLGVIAAISRANIQLLFSLAGNLLRDSGIRILCEQMVQTYKQLQQPNPANTDIHLYLDGNCITHKGVFVLSQVAQQTLAITGLSLSFNWSPHLYKWFEEELVMPVVDIESCLKYLVESLTSRISSKKFTISLAGNTLCNKHIWHLLLLLMSSNLFSLDLSGNCFGKLSLGFIAVALQHCMLKDLRLNKCGITSDSLSLLGKRLEFNSTLELLEIRNNLLSQPSLMEFFTHLRNNLSLARVWIDEWKDEYGKILERINSRRFHQGAMFLGCKVGEQAKTYLVRPNVSSSLLDSSEFSFRQLYPQSLYGPTQFPDRYK